MIRWLCRGCKNKMSCDEMYVGKRAKCAQCSAVQLVPAIDEMFDVKSALPHLAYYEDPSSSANVAESVHLWEAEQGTHQEEEPPKSGNDSPSKCVWCETAATRGKHISGWEFPFCGNDTCVDDATELINQHIFQLMWLEDDNISSLPDTPQMRGILQIIQNNNNNSEAQ